MNVEQPRDNILIDEILKNNIISDQQHAVEIEKHKFNQNVKNLATFFKDNGPLFRTEKNDPRTNIIDYYNKATYYVPPGRIDELFGLLEACRRDGVTCHYQEVQSAPSSGIMVDFDIYQTSPKREITDAHIERLNKKICLCIRDLTTLAKEGQASFHSFVIMRPEVSLAPDSKQNTERSIYKDGVHILFPEIKVNRPIKRFLIDRLIKAGITSSIFGGPTSIVNGPTMLDKNSAHVNIFFIGSAKQDSRAYGLSHIFLNTIDEDGISVALKGPDYAKDWNICRELSLLFLSDKLAKKEYIANPTIEDEIRIFSEKTQGNLIDEEAIEATEDSISVLTVHDAEARTLRDLLTILDVSYAEEYGKWMAVLFAIAHTSIYYKPLAAWFSQRCPTKYNSTAFEAAWGEAMGKRHNGAMLTKRSIHYWAKLSNPEKYKEIMDHNYQHMLLKDALEFDGVIEDGIVAKVLHSMLADKFTVDILDGTRDGYTWWEFVLPEQRMKKGEVYKWRQEVQPDVIYIFIQEHMVKIYNYVIEYLTKRRDEANGRPEAIYWKKIVDNMKKSKINLTKSTFKNGVVKEARYKFRDRGFAAQLDNYDDVIGVGNGILRLGREPSLIKGFHEYKISKYTEVDYRPYDEANPWIQLIEKAFETSFPEPDAREWFKYYFSMAIDPREVDAVFTMMVGGGSNGKSFWVETLSNTIGEKYSTKISVKLLTNGRESSDKANTSFMSTEGKLFVYFSEPNREEKFDSGRVKEMFGGEKQGGHDKFGKHKTFKMRASPLLVSNYDVCTDCTDDGFWRRCFYYRTKIKYKKEPNPDNPYERQEDPRFINEYKNKPEFLAAMLSVLVYYNQVLHCKYGGNIKNVACPTIRRETEEFRNRMDTINKFITQMIVKSESGQPLVGQLEAPEYSLLEIVDRYMEWYRTNIDATVANKMNIQNLSNQFENSCLASSLIRKSKDYLVLRGHRIRGAISEPLFKGELPLGNQSPDEFIYVG
jgi:phage/plasmid-associated DNA primase